MFHKKAAIELSLNFLVVIIIAIVIFGFGIIFIYNLSSSAIDLTKLTVDDVDRKISNLACGSFNRICVPSEKKVIKRDGFDVFGLKLLNVYTDPARQNFQIFVSPPIDLTLNSISDSDTVPPGKVIGFRKDDTPIVFNPSPLLIVLPISRIKTVKMNEEHDFAIGVQVPKDAPSGTYVLDVMIKQGDEQYVPIQKLYVEVP
jgi:hypothetical protein